MMRTRILSIGPGLFLAVLFAVDLIVAAPAGAEEKACQTAFPLTQGNPPQSRLQLGLASSAPQLSGAWYPPEEDKWRWMGQSAGIHLKRPEDEEPRLELEFILPPELLSAVGTVDIVLNLDEQFLDRLSYAEPGEYTYRGFLTGTQLRNPVPCLQISVGQTFRPPKDKRDLGVAVVRAGFVVAKKAASAKE